MDYLDADSVRAFIDITYEEYYSRFQKYFENGTITSAFYDEPTFWPWPGTTPYGAEGARLWTPEYNKAYEETFNGESPVLNYPALWYEIGKDTDEARNKLQYVRTELFAENYIGQIADWCDDHGIDLMGHMLLEEWVNPVGLHGDLMKVFKDQQIPGVDVIGSYGYTQEAYKIISSSANNWDKGVVMSESFGAMGENMDKNILYKSSMDQYAKGVNMIIPHAIWYDNINHVDAPPEHKVKDNQDIYFIANSSDTAMNITVSLRGEMEQPMLWDPMTGTKQAATFTVENGITKVQLSLTGIQSMFIVDETQPVVEETDKSILQTVIQYAENAKKTDEYTNAIPSVKDSFDKALTDAKAINDNDSATQEQIDTAWRTLLNEIHKLGFQAGDKTKLQALYDEMSKVDLDDYKDGVSKENFVKALEQAATVLADPNIMQLEIDKAYDELETAYSLLEKAADSKRQKNINKKNIQKIPGESMQKRKQKQKKSITM